MPSGVGGGVNAAAPATNEAYQRALRGPRATVAVWDADKYEWRPMVTLLRARFQTRADVLYQGTTVSVRSDDPDYTDVDGDDLYRAILDLENCTVTNLRYDWLEIVGFSDEGLTARLVADEYEDSLRPLDPDTLVRREARSSRGRFRKYRVTFNDAPYDGDRPQKEDA